MSVYLGLGVIAALFLVMALFLDEKHFFIKILALFFCVLSMLAMASDLLGNQDHCDFVVTSINETYEYGNNFTGYHWDYDVADAPEFNNPNDPASVFLFHKQINYGYSWQCENTDRPGAGLSIFKMLNYFLRILLVYMFLYLIYWIFDYFGINLLRLAERYFKR